MNWYHHCLVSQQFVRTRIASYPGIGPRYTGMRFVLEYFRL